MKHWGPPLWWITLGCVWTRNTLKSQQIRKHFGSQFVTVQKHAGPKDSTDSAKISWHVSNQETYWRLSILLLGFKPNSLSLTSHLSRHRCSAERTGREMQCTGARSYYVLCNQKPFRRNLSSEASVSADRNLIYRQLTGSRGNKYSVRFQTCCVLSQNFESLKCITFSTSYTSMWSMELLLDKLGF